MKTNKNVDLIIQRVIQRTDLVFDRTRNENEIENNRKKNENNQTMQKKHIHKRIRKKNETIQIEKMFTNQNDEMNQIFSTNV